MSRTESELGRLASTLNDSFDRLQQAVEKQSRFTADASHELRTPVSVVLTVPEQTLARERDGDEYRESLAAVLRAARRMKNIVDGLLVLTRADSGQVALDRVDLDVGRVVEETIELLGPLAKEHGVALEQAGPHVEIQGDRERLREVFTNLIANGIRYNRADGQVRIELAEKNGNVDVSVRDTGIGIPAQHLPHLFDRFYRVDPARSRKAGGSGLGLAISRWVVESHGGSITVESTEGEGTTFTVSLPKKP